MDYSRPKWKVITDVKLKTKSLVIKKEQVHSLAVQNFYNAFDKII